MNLFAVSTGIAIVYGVALWMGFLIPMTVTVLKRHWILFAAGWLVIGSVWWIAAFRLARPDSWWARRFYDYEKLARARQRYEAAPK